MATSVKLKAAGSCRSRDVADVFTLSAGAITETASRVFTMGCGACLETSSAAKRRAITSSTPVTRARTPIKSLLASMNELTRGKHSIRNHSVAPCRGTCPSTSAGSNRNPWNIRCNPLSTRLASLALSTRTANERGSWKYSRPMTVARPTTLSALPIFKRVPSW